MSPFLLLLSFLFSLCSLSTNKVISRGYNIRNGREREGRWWIGRCMDGWCHITALQSFISIVAAGGHVPVAVVSSPLASLSTPRAWRSPGRRRWPSARRHGPRGGTCCRRHGGWPACCSRRTRRGSRRACRCCSPPTARSQPSSIYPSSLQGGRRGKRRKGWIRECECDRGIVCQNGGGRV